MRLAEALSLWKATGPDAYVRAQVNEALMDLIKDPLHWGTEDPHSRGVLPALSLLPRDTFAFESPLSYDGGNDGTEILRRVLTESARFVRQGGELLLELGGEQAGALSDDLTLLGYADVAPTGG